MDDSTADANVNGSQSDVKQNCVENNAANSLPPSSDPAKKTSFEITSITEPNIDDNDEDSPDTDPEHRTDIKQEVDLQSYTDSLVVYNTTNDIGSSAPVIPTSSQYGLAIVDNSENGLSVGSIKSEDIHNTDACSQKSECDLNGVQNKNRNERFKVVKIESTEPFKRGRWVCMDFLDHSMNQQQPSKMPMVNGDSVTCSQANDTDTSEQPLDNTNGHQECSEFKASTNNVSTYTSNCNTTDNYKNQTSTYNIVSSGVTTPIHSACVSPGQSLQSNMQVPVQTSQPAVVATSVHTSQPQSLTQVQLPAQHNINQSCMPPHSSLQSHQLQQVIANAGVMQPQLQQTQPVINVMQNQNPPIQQQSIQHLNSVEHVTQTMPQQYQQPLSQANLQQQQIMQHNMSAQFQKSFVPQNQSALPNCPPLQQSVNQMINQQVPQYYNTPPVQSQNVTSEPSTTVPMSNQHISQQQFQSMPIQNHIQLQQNQQQLPPPVQQMQQQPNPQQNMVQQNPMQPQMVQQNQQLSHQPSISQPNQPHQTQQQTQQIAQQHIQQPQQTSQPQQTHVQQVPSSQQQQQTPQQIQQVSQQIQASQGSQIQQQLPSQQSHHITQLTQMTSQPQQMSQSNQMQQIAQQGQQIPQQIALQTQQISQQTQLQSQQINQQQIPQQQHMSQIAGQNQMVHQNNQQITHAGQIISQQNLNQGQQLNQQNQQVQQQNQQQIQQPSQSMSQQIIQPNQSIPQQNQVIPQQLGINQSNSQMSVSQNQQVIQPQHNMQQSGQQYQQPQQMMTQPQQLPMQANQPIMHQPTYSQAQSLNAMQLQQVQMSSIPTNTVTSTQMHIQQQQPVAQSNMMQPSQINVIPQNSIQPTIPMSQQQMTYSLQQHVPINPNYVNSMQNCYIPSQQQMPPYKPSTKTVETVNIKKEDNSEDTDSGTTNGNGTTTVAIDNKIEQAMDLVKSHLMYAVREEVEVLKEKISELMDKVGQLETENSNLRMLVPPDILEQYNREKQKPTNGQSSHNQ